MEFVNKHFFLCLNFCVGMKIFWNEHLGMGTSEHSFQVICLQSGLLTVLQLVVFFTLQVNVLASLFTVLG